MASCMSVRKKTVESDVDRIEPAWRSAKLFLDATDSGEQMKG